MERPKTPYQEITSEENLEIHGGLTTRSWRGVQVLRARARFFEEPFLDEFVNDLIRTSGSIDGKHRDSTTQAVQGQKSPGVALVGVQPNGHAAPAQVNGRSTV